MATKRKTISKSLRFEVFKRDAFTCQYCGSMAPDIVLEVDHINPVCRGGDNDIMNLITSCFDCNRGKGKKQLTDNQVVKKQQEQLKELHSKREQLEMMLSWKKELIKFEDEQLKYAEDELMSISGIQLSETGQNKLKRLINDYGLTEIMECIQISVSQYYRESDYSSYEKTINYIGRIAHNRKNQKSNPVLYKHNYIKAILKNNNMLFNENRLRIFLQKECLSEYDFNAIKLIATTCKNWTDFWQQCNDHFKGDY